MIWAGCDRRLTSPQVPGHEELQAIPTFIYSMISTRLRHRYSLDLMKALKRNVEYWRSALSNQHRPPCSRCARYGF